MVVGCDGGDKTELEVVGDRHRANAGLWAAPGETREDIVAGFRGTWALGDVAIVELPLNAVGGVPRWRLRLVGQPARPD